MFMVCVGLVFGSKNVQFHIICSFRHSINISTAEDDSHSDSLRNGVMKPKNNAEFLTALSYHSTGKNSRATHLKFVCPRMSHYECY